MKKNLLYGVIVPAIFVIILIILNSLDIGFEVQENNVDSVNSINIFTSSVTSKTKIYSISLKNDYFMSKRYELPSFLVCAIDIEGLKESKTMKASYSGLGTKYSYRSIAEGKSVEIGKGQEETYEIIMDSVAGTGYKTSYNSYDQIIMIPKEDLDGSSNCAQVNTRNLENVRRIEIIN